MADATLWDTPCDYCGHPMRKHHLDWGVPHGSRSDCFNSSEQYNPYERRLVPVICRCPEFVMPRNWEFCVVRRDCTLAKGHDGDCMVAEGL